MDSSTQVWNHSSLGVSRSFGYRGTAFGRLLARPGELTEQQEVRLGRGAFRRPDWIVAIRGLEAAGRDLLGSSRLPKTEPASVDGTFEWRARTRYIYWVPDRRGHGHWTRYDFLALSLMIRGVLSPGSSSGKYVVTGDLQAFFAPPWRRRLEGYAVFRWPAGAVRCRRPGQGCRELSARSGSRFLRSVSSETILQIVAEGRGTHGLSLWTGPWR